jgi:hypothetical protein
VDNETEQLRSAAAEVLQKGEEERLTKEYFCVLSRENLLYAGVSYFSAKKGGGTLFESEERKIRG